MKGKGKPGRTYGSSKYGGPLHMRNNPREGLGLVAHVNECQ